MQAAKILVGADPELFMKNPNTNAFVSAHDRVPGTKYEPFKVPNGAIQVDGTALEFNIDPAHSVEEFVANIKSVKQTLESYVPGFNVVAEPVALTVAEPVASLMSMYPNAIARAPGLAVAGMPNGTNRAMPRQE